MLACNCTGGNKLASLLTKGLQQTNQTHARDIRPALAMMRLNYEVTKYSWNSHAGLDCAVGSTLLTSSLKLEQINGLLSALFSHRHNWFCCGSCLADITVPQHTSQFLVLEDGLISLWISSLLYKLQQNRLCLAQSQTPQAVFWLMTKFRGYSFLQPGTNLCDITVLAVIFLLGNCPPIHSGMAAAIFSLHGKGSVKKVLLCCSWKQFVILGFL